MSTYYTVSAYDLLSGPVEAKMNFPLSEYHFNRYFTERKKFISLCHQFENDQEQSRKAHEQKDKSPIEMDQYALFDFDQREEKSWKDIVHYLKCETENECIERYRQEQEDYRDIISTWKKNGSAVFQFDKNLLEMLSNTEVKHVPVNSFRCPYHTIYIHIGDTKFINCISDEYSIDGMYIVADYHEDILRNSLNGARKHYEWVSNLSQDQKKYYIKTNEEIYKQSFVNIYDVLDINMAAKKINEVETELNIFRNDIDSYNYSYISESNGKKCHHNYLCLYVVFTFRINRTIVKELLPSEICKEPFLKAEYIFSTHKSTVAEAIDNAYKNGFSKDTYLDNSRDEESILNVINVPKHLNEVSKMVFNLLCYISWKDNDVIVKYPNKKLQEKIDNSNTAKDRQRNISKAESNGFRKVHFCGFRTEYPQANSVNASSALKSHWRRGHWRNHAVGPKLRDHKLIWIHPTIVKAESTNHPPTETTFYSV